MPADANEFGRDQAPDRITSTSVHGIRRGVLAFCPGEASNVRLISDFHEVEFFFNQCDNSTVSKLRNQFGQRKEDKVARSEELFDAIVDGKAPLAQSIVEEELGRRRPGRLISGTMIPAMDEVGKLFQEEEYFVPELMLAGRAMKAAMEPSRPLLRGLGASRSEVVAGAVKGDLHDIGKNLVVSMLEGAGFKVIDLGSDVTPRNSSRRSASTDGDRLPVGVAHRDHDVDEVDDRGDRGGGPAGDKDYGRRRADHEEFAIEIGADGFSVSATDAVALARRQVGL